MNEEDFRDVCAMLAMNGLLHHYDFDKFAQDPARVADWAYVVADAMIAQKNKEEPEEGIAVIKKRKYVRKN